MFKRINPRALTPLHLSCACNDKSIEVNDRIAFILVRDGIKREKLVRYLDLDETFPVYAQPDRPPAMIIADVADFLGVSVQWLLAGEGRNVRMRDAATTDRSVVVSHSSAREIIVNNYTERV